MDPVAAALQASWPVWLVRLRTEYVRLAGADRRWLADRSTAIGAGQERLDHLFQQIGGGSVCAACEGGCCGAGRHHLTFANLLPYLAAGTDPPSPEFARSCPYLGRDGCLLPVRVRPYTCITFFCGTLDERFSPAQRRIWQATDRALREEYAAIAARHPIGRQTGFWLAAMSLGEQPFLDGLDASSC